ncbi:ADP-ribosylglycohydrolase family protein [Actinokineospora sp.]|uniref:ADP-ribosylglycohydrolase family protein n=1 Tax=Actinokineospora sp. TaxID=1872133 RepID=UPI003D6B3E2F
MAHGDALGEPTEFMTVEEIDRAYGPTGPRDLVGDPALVTDDTQMALAVAWALHGVDHLTADSELTAYATRLLVDGLPAAELVRCLASAGSPRKRCSPPCIPSARGRPG